MEKDTIKKAIADLNFVRRRMNGRCKKYLPPEIVDALPSFTDAVKIATSAMRKACKSGGADGAK